METIFSLGKVIFLFCFVAVLPSELEKQSLFKDDTISELLEDENGTVIDDTSVKFRLKTTHEGESHGCLLSLGQRDCLDECGFNATAKTFFVVHGWTISGLLPEWFEKLVFALQQRERDANVVTVDWLVLAHQHYPNAVNNTKAVGSTIAHFLDWLQVELNISLQNIHIIGYSLGAHVAGFAGNYVNGTIGRITGLDPAGPMFEGVEDHKRLSPDDANFVDVLHTYTREALGVSIGIQQPIGHIDIYPNGGDIQPGCGLTEMLTTISAGAFGEVVQCEHERSVFLFVDSLLHKDHESIAYECTDPGRFKKGICLSCRKNRCGKLGYNVKKRARRNSKMYLKTRADMPYAGYHYQMKMHVFSKVDMEDKDPSLFVKLSGSFDESENMPVQLPDSLGLNYTNSFLVFTDLDLGELHEIKLKWEGTSWSWTSMWKKMKTLFYEDPNKNRVLEVRRIRVKAGETQKKYVFCAKEPSVTHITPGSELTFVKCADGWEPKHRKRQYF
ncbi:endothelial lipase [Polypterus senegalus]|uniref:endothelial lipase n=1 Tax=Polypterus senegalus TaxID=55291 RepID=UPI0019651DEC|nr:endothelial lipase [Polypterus senegalus]